MSTPWKRIDPPTWAPPAGYANAVETRGGRHLHVAGQVAFDEEARILHAGDLAAQTERTLQNLLTVLAHGGAQPEHVVRLRIYVLDARAWRDAAKAIGRAWRAAFGRWYPAMTLVQVARLYEDDALVEIEAEAVVPDDA